MFEKDHRDRDEQSTAQDVRPPDVRHELDAVKMREMASARPASRIPDFFVVGAPRTGTTALFEYLGRHPQIFLPRLKEAMFFGADLAYDRRMSLDEYVALFADAGDAVRVGEVSTTYLYSRTAASEIREFNSEARIIIPLRDPITVMHAVHSLLVWIGFEPIHNFSAALEAQERERTGPNPPIRREPYYRDIVDFADHVGRYFDAFGRGRVHVIVFDDWVADAPSAYRQTLEFLEVDPSFVLNLGVVNPNRRVRSQRLHDLLVGRATRAVPVRVRPKIKHLLNKLTTREAPREPIDPALLASLRVEFAPKIERLAKLIDRDLSAWIAEPQRLPQ